MEANFKYNLEHIVARRSTLFAPESSTEISFILFSIDLKSLASKISSGSISCVNSSFTKAMKEETVTSSSELKARA